MLKIYSKTIFRLPQFPINADIITYWEELKESIADVSPSLYRVIKNVSSNSLDQLNDSSIQSVWKYMNRSQYRCTPYGSLASFGLVDLNGLGSQGTKLIIGMHQCVHQFPDWSRCPKLGFSPTAIDEFNDIKLFSNSSYYRVGKSLRYLVLDDSEFQLAEIEFNMELFLLLEKCKFPISFLDLAKGFSSEQLTDLLEVVQYLIESQLLYTDHNSNIIGQDFFSRIPQHLDKNVPIYSIAERKLISGQLDIRLFRYIPQLIACLENVSVAKKAPRLEEFVNQFIARYELREVPLMEVLDPEIGIGYGNMERPNKEESIIQELLETRKVETSNSEAYDERWLRALADLNGKDFLDLERLSSFKNSDSAEIPLPNTMSLLCQIAGEKVVINSIGGATATALLGRFSVANKEVTGLCQDLSKIESLANPDVLFFDIAYQAEGRVDNVNRRASLFAAQLSIFDYDTTETPLLLHDLLVSVQGGEVILRSRRLNRRLIPRLASAYNAERSDLPVFCLLCDLQHQGIASTLWPALSRLVPGLERYPEVRFRNIVLSPRSWKIPKNEKAEVFYSFLDDIGSKCRWVRMGAGDQKLHFDLQSPSDLAMLLQLGMKESKKPIDIYLEEWYSPLASPVVDSIGNDHAAEFILSLYHEDKIFNGIMSPNATVDELAISTYELPGDHWLYLEIFAKPQKLENLLQGLIPTFLNLHQDQIQRYFFIRYGDGGEHLRLRLELRDLSFMGKITASFSDMLREEVMTGGVTEIKVGTYRREQERYGSDIMMLVEDWFFQDSVFVIATLSENLSLWAKYHSAIVLFESILNNSVLDISCFNTIVDKARENLDGEYQLQAASYRMINDFYSQFVAAEQALSITLVEQLNTVAKSLEKILNRCASKRRKRKLVVDLFHMHINRQFITNQRLHEAVIYHFIYRRSKSQK